MIAPIVQNDDRLNAHIRKEGCLFRSLQMIAEIQAGRCLTPDEISFQYAWLIERGYMKENCYIIDHAAVIRSAQYGLNGPQRARYVLRTSETGIGDFEMGVPPNAFIRHFKTVNGYGHFVVADRFGNRLWDPYWPPTEPVKELTFRGYAI